MSRGYKALALVAFVSIPLLALAGSTGARASDVPESEYARLEKLVASSLAQYPELPQDSAPTVRIARKGAKKIEGLDASPLLVMPVRISFAGTTNGYCRLAIVNAEKTRAVLVPLPVDADSDSCASTRLAAASDFNGDGVVDFACSVQLPSNRYPTTVEEFRVYLSRKGELLNYCFAPEASEAALTASPVPKAIAAEVERRGTSVLRCYEK